MRRRSITGPLILIAVGLVWLLNNLGQDIPFWTFIGANWPFILIGIGVIRLVEVLFWFSRGPMPGRPVGGGGWVFLTVVLCVLAAILVAHRHGVNIGYFNPRTGINIIGADYDFNVEGTMPAAGISRVIVDTGAGDVTVHGADGADIKVSGHKTIRALNRSEGDRAESDSRLRLAREGDAMVIRFDQPAHATMIKISADLDIVVPRGVDVESRGQGDLSVDGVSGSVTASGARGDVHLTNIGKDARITANRTGLVQAEHVKGTIDLTGRGDDVRFENIDGPVSVNGEFSGTLEFRALTKALHFESSRSDFRVEQIPGTATVDLHELKLDNVVGPVRFRSSSRDIEVHDVTAALDLNVDRGDIELTSSKTPLPKMDVHTRNGDITLTLPEKAAFDLDGRTTIGDADNEYGSPLEQTHTGRAASIRGRSGNGPQVTLLTDRGTLSVRKQ